MTRDFKLKYEANIIMQTLHSKSLLKNSFKKNGNINDKNSLYFL